MTGQGLSAGERIRRRPEFERVFKEGARVHGRFMTVFVLPNGSTAARLGVAATRKVGSATERNRAKRLVREVFRRQKVAAGLDIIVVPRRDILDAPFASLEADYHTALERCRRTTRHPRQPRGQRAHPRAVTRL
jgi:ribonuclease P protein component